MQQDSVVSEQRPTSTILATCDYCCIVGTEKTKMWKAKKKSIAIFEKIQKFCKIVIFHVFHTSLYMIFI